MTSKGRGSLADEILRIAKEHNIPVREDRNLIQILSRLELDEQIPLELYRVIAEILAFVYRTSNRYQEIANALSRKNTVSNGPQPSLQSPVTNDRPLLEGMRIADCGLRNVE